MNKDFLSFVTGKYVTKAKLMEGDIMALHYMKKEEAVSLEQLLHRGLIQAKEVFGVSTTIAPNTSGWEFKLTLPTGEPLLIVGAEFHEVGFRALEKIFQLTKEGKLKEAEIVD